ncbi:MAG: hypothetical protein ACYDH2_06305 [Anaerolineaceae bacterium]
MDLGIGEITIIVIQGVLLIGIPITLMVVGVVLFQRIKSLEARIEKLESKRNDITKEKMDD